LADFSTLCANICALQETSRCRYLHTARNPPCVYMWKLQELAVYTNVSADTEETFCYCALQKIFLPGYTGTVRKFVLCLRIVSCYNVKKLIFFLRGFGHFKTVKTIVRVVPSLFRRTMKNPPISSLLTCACDAPLYCSFQGTRHRRPVLV
jgi:hypothetical protein